ncbi:hypothetical protein [Salibacterium lacus]|uniref:Uncharacterized protein n=1 Tax=Salibacterium lacus TaxID=1898109 RepID=A0ABW5T2L8_9BACI
MSAAFPLSEAGQGIAGIKRYTPESIQKSGESIKKLRESIEKRADQSINR